MTTTKKKIGAVPYAEWVDTGVKLHRKAAMDAKCYECMGGYEDGAQDCQGVTCPLYPYFPYKIKLKRDKS